MKTGKAVQRALIRKYAETYAACVDCPVSLICLTEDVEDIMPSSIMSRAGGKGKFTIRKAELGHCPLARVGHEQRS